MNADLIHDALFHVIEDWKTWKTLQWAFSLKKKVIHHTSFLHQPDDQKTIRAQLFEVRRLLIAHFDQAYRIISSQNQGYSVHAN